jgi:four helix bundle protein
MSKDSVVYERSKCFAARILRLNSYLKKKGETVVSAQVVRSGTSIGANVAEALYASSRRDFLAKITIAQKECAETLYWLELLADGGYFKSDKARSILGECEVILKMLVATTKNFRASSYEVRESADDYNADFANPLTEGGEPL